MEVVEEVEEESSESTIVPPSLRMARHRPFSSEYLSTALMSAMTTPGPRMAPMYLTVMLPSSATRLWQLVLWMNHMLDSKKKITKYIRVTYKLKKNGQYQITLHLLSTR